MPRASGRLDSVDATSGPMTKNPEVLAGGNHFPPPSGAAARDTSQIRRTASQTSGRGWPTLARAHSSSSVCPLRASIARVRRELWQFRGTWRGLCLPRPCVLTANGIVYHTDVHSSAHPARSFALLPGHAALALGPAADVDGTLTAPRKVVTPEMRQFLADLRKRVTVGVVGGSDLAKAKEQLGEDYVDIVDWAFPENGLNAFRDGKSIAVQSFKNYLGEDRLKKLLNWLLKYLADIDIPVKRGTFIEFRAGMLNVSPIGRNCRCVCANVRACVSSSLSLSLSLSLSPSLSLLRVTRTTHAARRNATPSRSTTRSTRSAPP
ncbi:MAG: HAD-IIB family hydrolase, partial [Promethearchaeia archaeon]